MVGQSSAGGSADDPGEELEHTRGSSLCAILLERFHQRGRLVHRPYRGLRLSYAVSDLEVASSDQVGLPERLRLPASTEIEVKEARDSDGRLPFIYKARFRR